MASLKLAAAATAGARSAPSRRSGARSSPVRPTSCWPRPSGWPATASASWCWSARTPPRTARTWATRGRWRSCCRSSPRSTASSGCGSATCSRPRPVPAWSRRSPPRPASRRTSTCRSSTPASRCCAGCAGSARPSGSWSCWRRPASWRPEAGARSNFIVGFPGETRADVAELERFLTEARLDAIGVFDYSDEDGTEAARPRPARSARPRSRGGTSGSARWPRSCATSGPRSGSAPLVDVLVETRGRRRRRGAGRPPGAGGRRLDHAGRRPRPGLRVGDLVRARVTGTDGVDLVAVPVETRSIAAPVMSDPAAVSESAVDTPTRRIRGGRHPWSTWPTR